MAFGIDDALTTATAGIGLADTVVQTIKRYRKAKVDYDFEMLLEEIRVTALRRIDEVDLALVQFERMLTDRKIDLNRRLTDIIADTPFWKPFEQHRLSQIQKRLNEYSDSIYCASDDIAALARCREQTQEMGVSVVESARAKHELHSRIINARSVREALDILRGQLVNHKNALSA